MKKRTIIAHPNIKEEKLSPIVKWTGGKSQELNYVFTHLPKTIHNYYEPFVGGGAVYFSLKANKYFINDKSEELILLYKAVRDKDDSLYSVIDEFMIAWSKLKNIVEGDSKNFIKIYKEFKSDEVDENRLKEWIKKFIYRHKKTFNLMFHKHFQFEIDNFTLELNKNIFRKIKRMKKLDKERRAVLDKDVLNNIEASIKSAFYMQVRHLYNIMTYHKISTSKQIALFFFIRNYAYSGMFRYNKEGHFNVPYGGIGYNSKNLKKNIEIFKSKELINHLLKTKIEKGE